ncbi:MAG: hypothetical protein ACI9LY_003876 [Arenicella sp.]|jgi:hypothetical protein
MQTSNNNQNSGLTDTSPASEKGHDGWKPHRFNGHGLIKGMHFGVPLPAAHYKPSSLLDFYKRRTKEDIEEKSDLHLATSSTQINPDYIATTHDHDVIFSKQSAAMIVLLLRALSFWFLLLSPITILFLAMDDGLVEVLTDPGFMGMLISLVLIHTICRLAMDKGWVQPKVKAILFRAIGLVYIYPEKGGEAIIKPFSEFNAFINSSPNPKSGVLYYTLFLAHRDNSKLWFAYGDETGIQQDIFMKWEHIQQYMDASQPLPDVPELEPFRHLDEVTAGWDKQHQRPPKLFEEMTDRTFSKYINKILDYSNGFNWGETRESAIRRGWQSPPEEFWKIDIGENEPQ